MKKLITISLLAILLLSFQVANTSPAYYSSPDLGPALRYQTWTYIDTSFFSDIRNGVVTLSGNSFTPQGWTGLINVSGTCTTKRPPGYIALVLQAGSKFYVLVESGNTTNSFAIAVDANVTHLSVYQSDPSAANPIKCTVLFEAAQ